MKIKQICKRFAALLTVVMIVLSCSFEAFAAKDEFLTKKVTVGVMTNLCPNIYLDSKTGEVVGIGADLVRYSCREAGYTVEFKQVAEENLKAALDNDAYDVVVPFGSAISSAEGKPTIVTDPLFQNPVTIVTLKKKRINDNLFDFNHLRAGMLSSLYGISETIKSMYPGINISYYDTMDDCVKALRSGEVEALLNNSYAWSYYLQKPSYSDLKVHPSNIITMEFCIGATDTPEHRELIAELNRGIEAVPDMQRQAVILDYTSRQLYEYTLGDYLYQYWELYILVILLIEIMALVDKLKKVVNTPITESLVCWIKPDKTTQTIMNKLYHTSIHHLLMHIMPSKKSNLVRVEFRHIVSIQTSTNSIKNGIYESTHKGVHSLFCCLLQHFIIDSNVDHIINNSFGKDKYLA